MGFARGGDFLNTTVNRIKDLIEETGLTVRELAEAANCSKSAMQRYISGERDIPTYVITGLADLFHVHAAYLFGWVDDRNYTIEKQPAASIEDNELDENKKALMRLVRNCSDEDAGRLLQIMQLFLDNAKQGN